MIGTNSWQIGGPALTNMLSYIQTNSDVWLGWAWWGGGPWWAGGPGNPNTTPQYMFLLDAANLGEPNQTDQPAMDIIKQFFPLPAPALQLVNNNQFQFSAPQGFVYQIQFSTDLTSSNNWTNFGSAITNVPPPGSPSISAPFTVNMTVGSDSQGFYRVQVNHAP